MRPNYDQSGCDKFIVYEQKTPENDLRNTKRRLIPYGGRRLKPSEKIPIQDNRGPRKPNTVRRSKTNRDKTEV